MIEVLDGLLYQWDSGRKVQLNMSGVSEVHFSNFATDNALIVAPYEKDGAIIADIPNILLQKAYTIDIYLVQGEQTVYKHKLPVNARPKPSDYVYTETEVQSYRALETRLAALEAGGGVSDPGDFELFAEIVTDNTDTAVIDFTAAADGTALGQKEYKEVFLWSPSVGDSGLNTSGQTAELRALLTVNGQITFNVPSFTRPNAGILYVGFVLDNGTLTVIYHGRDTDKSIKANHVSVAFADASGVILIEQKLSTNIIRFGCDGNQLLSYPKINNIQSIELQMIGGTLNQGIPFQVLGR